LEWYNQSNFLGFIVFVCRGVGTGDYLYFVDSNCDRSFYLFAIPIKNPTIIIVKLIEVFVAPKALQTPQLVS